MDLLSQLFSPSTSGLMPHGHCYLWQVPLIWLHAGSDLAIGIAYLAIPFTMLWLYRRRPDLPFRWIFLAFTVFIVSCGATHLFEVVTLWVPAYWASGGVKVFTALASLLTAIGLVKAMPQMLSIPSYVLLRAQIDERKRVELELQAVNEDLERRVGERTSDLEAAFAALRESEERLHTLVEHAPEAIVVLDLNFGKFTLVNENACLLFALPRAALLQRGPVELSAPVQPDGRAAEESAREKLDAAMRGETPVFEWMHRDARGNDILCEIRLVRLPSSGAALIRGSIIDITARKRMENALRESEAKFAAVFHTCPEPVTIGLWPQGTFLDANEAFERQFGYARGSVLGRTALSLGLWAQPERRPELVRLVEQYQRVDDFEVEYRRRDGSTWIGQLSAALTEVNGERCIVMLVRDTTLERRAQRALQDSEAKFSTVFRTCPESVSFSLWDEGTYLEVNDAYERLYGYTRSEVIGRSAVALGLWVDPAERQTLLARLESEGRVTGFECRFRRKGGETWLGELSAEGSVLNGQRCLVVILRDVTAHKSAAEALRKSEEKFSKVFRTCPETITIATLDDGTYLDVNDAFERLYGVPRAEAIGQSTLALGLWGDPQHRDELVRQLREHRRVTGFTTTIRHRSRGIRTAEIAAEAIDIDGRDCLIAVVRDISDQQRAEQEIRSLNAELEERVHQRTAELEVANRELESFSYLVSHDLRAPLRSIHGFSEALLEDCGAVLSEQGKHFLGRIQRASQRMGQLIDDLLKLSHVTRSQMVRRPVDLTALANDVIRDLQSAEPGRRVEVSIEQGLVAHGDARLLRVLLDNLLGNAWKFTSKMPVARIELRRKPGSPDVFQVKDNGAGFDMNYAQNLFGAFQRQHAATEFPGTGIGLATVQRIVRRHGGRIWAESAVSEGARFLFTLGGENLPT